MIAKGSTKYTAIDNQMIIAGLRIMDSQIKAKNMQHPRQNQAFTFIFSMDILRKFKIACSITREVASIVGVGM
jgi:hypothetical protein